MSNMQMTEALVGGQGSTWSWNTFSFWTFNGKRKYDCFL